MKIKELQLHNFKFFTDTDNKLNIDSKNVLIWGENGSGKSSIYWAIYTLLQCSYKDQQGIDNYFTENHEKNLLNIHKLAGAPAFIQMILDNGDTYKIGLADYSIINNSDIQLSAVSSDFINYQVLASFLSFYHRHDPVLFAMFETEIFRYLQFNPPAPYAFSFFNDAWEELKKPLIKTKVGRTYKYPDLHSTVYLNKNNLKNSFNIQLATLLGNVTTKANQILQDPNGFNMDIEIELVYQQYDFEVSNRNSDYRETLPEIYLKVRRYNGLTDVVKKPHSFLNEAKKTAIGLAIRLGILERRLLANKLNLLALDDLLVSLDMSNRQIVLKLLLEQYQRHYQLLIFTHDRQFFNLTRRTIETQYKKSDWLFWEMYENNIAAAPKPYFKPEKDSVLIAEDFLIQNDFPAAGIYLRKEVERLLAELLPESLRKEPKTENGVTRMIDKKLNDQIIELKRFCQAENIDYAPFVDLKTYKDLILNPLAHSDNETLLFRDEMKKLIVIMRELKKVKRGRLFLSSNKYLNFVLNKPTGEYFSVRMKTQERLVLLEEDGKPARISIYCKCIVNSTDNNGTIDSNAEQFDTVKEAYDEMCRRFVFIPTGNFSEAFSYDGKTFANRLAEINTQ